MRKRMRGDVLVDLRNVYTRQLAEQAGFVYRGVGRGMARHATNGASHPPRHVDTVQADDKNLMAQISRQTERRV
jgi:hypothetical protein